MNFDPDKKISIKSNKGLTEREADILDYISDGMMPGEIAKELNVSYWTVKTHLKKIYKKLGVHNMIQAAVVGINNGFTRKRKKNE